MNEEQQISLLKNLIEELKGLGGFEFRNVSRLKDINNRYVEHLWKVAETQNVDKGMEITFSTEERTRDINFADGPTRAKKDAQFAERYYYKSCSGLINDIEYRISSIEHNLRRKASRS
jgi:hypothetical protein